MMGVSAGISRGWQVPAEVSSSSSWVSNQTSRINPTWREREGEGERGERREREREGGKKRVRICEPIVSFLLEVWKRRCSC
jgi:hypothetical protein